jgi:hypothetical protein
MKNTIVVLFLVSLLLTACGAGTPAESPTPLPDQVDWPTAVSLLHTGQVDMVVQLHNLTVTLTMKDGQQVKTVEPTIDAIFDEIQICGAPCSNITLATE